MVEQKFLPASTPFAKADEEVETDLLSREKAQESPKGILSLRLFRFFAAIHFVVSLKLGVSRQTVNAIDTERYEPSLGLAFKIARLFRMSIEEIFGPETH